LTVPRPSPHALDAPLGDELVVFDPDRTRLHLLNASAALIWATCDGERTVDQVTDLVADACGLPVETIADDVATTVATYLAEGLLQRTDAEDGPDTPADRAPHDESAPEPDASDPSPVATLPAGVEPLDEVAEVPTAAPDPLPDDARPAAGPVDGTGDAGVGGSGEVSVVATLGPYVALEHRFVIEVDDAALGAHLTSVLRPLAASVAQERTGPVHTYVLGACVGDDDRPERGDELTVWFDDEVVSRSTSRHALVDLLLWHLNQAACLEGTDSLHLHASAVATPAGVLAFPAESGSGKSTLVAGLVRGGRPYVTDECVALDLHDAAVRTYPKPIALKRGSWTVVPDLEPVAADGVEVLLGEIWQVDPTSLDGGVADSGLPLGAVVFPSYRPDETSRLQPVPPEEAVVRLARCCFNLVATGQAGLDRLVETCREVPCFELTVTDLASGCSQVDDLVERLSTAPPATRT
jgi:hypothetical protein